MNKISSTEKLALSMCFGVSLGTIFYSLAIVLALEVACRGFAIQSKIKIKNEVFSNLIFAAVLY